MEEDKRTTQQNRALYKWFSILAEDLNEQGIDMRMALKPDIDIMWTKQNIHDYLWIPLQRALYSTNSTTKLSRKKEIDKIYDIIAKHLGEKFGFTCPPFPSVEEILNQQRDDNHL